ncbi:MAG: BMP family ABC transporter substrate-binding protein [Erysipelotrichaceae bacterium]|nr:BMP family ABC transporter substrate-binding protein [Erysipelotrichaceae bacterium]
MKKLFSLLMVLVLSLSLVACGAKEDNNTNNTTDEANDTMLVGMVCIGNENAAYDRNFYMAADAAKEILAAKGINVEWKYTYDHPEGDPVANDCVELAEAGAKVVILNSYGMENAMMTVAEDYPDTVFCSLTNEGSSRDELANTVNAFPSIFEGRYLAGVVAGQKLQAMIDAGELDADKAVMGYVGAYTFAEVISGYTSFYLGAKSVCPSVTMMVEFIGSWGDPEKEAAAAQDLIDRGAVLISQHSDSTTPATTAQANGKLHVGYNISMIDVAEDASLISSRIDWTNYFVYVIETVANGGTVDQDYMGYGLANGDVVLTELNEKIAAEGTVEAVEAAKAGIIDGSIKVFDTTTFTVGGVELTSSLVDMTGDFVGDEGYDAVSNGQYNESSFKSAPAFAERIDGITLVNEAY